MGAAACEGLRGTMDVGRGSFRGVLAALASALVAQACAGERPLNRQLVAPTETRRLDVNASPILKAHMKDGRLYVFASWSVNEQTRVVSGAGRLLDVSRQHEQAGPFVVAIADVALFETNVPPRTSPALAPLAVVTGVSLGVTAACLINPKACFGSCPTFYVSDGEREVLQAEGFSDSIAPMLEATDVDALYRAHPRDRAFRVRMTNEALETHVVKRVEVLSVPRPPGGRAFYAAGDGFYAATALHAATTCAAPEGDCADALRALDGKERSSPADDSNLATREELTLEFPETHAEALGLVIAARQTLLTTYLLYQGLAYLGTEATGALAELERNPAFASRVQEAHRVLGAIEVLVPDAQGRWRKAGEAFETGPLAVDAHLVRLPRLPPGNPRVRLRLTKGDWRLDWVGIAELGPRLEATHLVPRAVSGRTDDGQTVSPHPGDTIVTMPGDVYTFDFELPEHPERQELFLSSRGYYLEWIRQQWLAEESAARAALLLYTPALAMRWLAPDYKRQEAGMERLFWGSRYAHP
jgi:hypothetical protein